MQYKIKTSLRQNKQCELYVSGRHKFHIVTYRRLENLIIFFVSLLMKHWIYCLKREHYCNV